MPYFDENGDNFRIALNAEITAKAESDAMNSEFSLPVTLVLTATKTGEFALDVTAFEKPLANVTFVGNVLYLSFTETEGGDTVSLKVDPTEEDLTKLEAALNELLANFNPENMFPVPPSDDSLDTGDVSVPSEITEQLMTELQKLFGEMTPDELSSVLLGKASLAFNEDHSRFYISAQGGFDYLNTTLGKVAAIIDDVLPEDVTAEMEGITFADIFGAFQFRSNSNMIDFIFDAEGLFCGLGIDVGIAGTDSEMAEAMGLKGAEADVKLVFELTIDDTLTVTAPDGSADYDVLTVDQIIAMLEEMMGAMGGANKEEPNMDAASLGLVPQDGVIILSHEPTHLADQLTYINFFSEDPMSEFDCIFVIQGYVYSVEEYEGECFVTLAHNDLTEDDDLFYDTLINFTANKSYTEGESVTVHFALQLETIDEEFVYVSFVEAE